jgi:hypothetical protein
VATPKAFAALAHPPEAPMAFALTTGENLWIHASAIIAHSYG